MSFHSRAAFAGATAVLLAIAPMAQAKTIKISGHLVTENGATTTPSGQVTGSFNTETDKVTYTITYSGLSGPVVAAHFHGPAAPGQDAPVMLPIPGPFHSGMHGKLTANAATAKALLAGQTYVNLHTAKYQAGEARAQLTAGS